MKEAIYTIPINDAFDADCGCPFCYLYAKLQDDRVAYTLGASMMDPDCRIQTNILGFCSKHYSMLLEQPNKLSLALVLETHLADVRKRIGINEHGIKSQKASKKLLFSKPGGNQINTLIAALDSIQSSCSICNKVDSTMERYIEVFFYMWQNDAAFQNKFNASKGFCIPHYKQLLQNSSILKGKKTDEFAIQLFDKQQEYLSSLQDDITYFTKKFDYRNQDLPWNNAEDAPRRTADVLAGQT